MELTDGTLDWDDPNMEWPEPPPENFNYLEGLVSNPDETFQANIIACAVITWAISAIFVGLRFYSRRWLLRKPIGAEDWLVVVALIFSGATSAGFIEQAVYGMGRHILDIDPSVVLPMTRAAWYSILWYMLSLAATKMSICLLYLRVLSFRHSRWVVYGLLAVVLGTSAWTLYTVLTACQPLQAFWTFMPGAMCRSERDWYLNTGLHIATDVVMYVLPLPLVIGLRVGIRQKLALYAILALGLFVCVISIVRLWDLTQQGKRIDYPYENVSIPYLTTVEINAAITVACCMTLRPAMNKWFPRFSSPAGNAQGWGQNAGEAAGVAEAADHTQGPPTIGSTPLRKPAAGRCVLDNLGSLDEYDEEGGAGAGRDEKRSFRTETDAASLTETASGSAKPGTPSEPRPTYAPERRDAGRA